MDEEILTYAFVGTAEENGVLTVGIADDELEPSQYLLFQQWIDREGSERQRGVYIERNGQESGAYGGIEEAVLTRDNLRLKFAEATAAALSTARRVKVIFPPEQYDRLRAGLERVLEGLLRIPSGASDVV